MTFKALLALFGSLITGPIKCGILRYGVNSTFFGSTSNIFTSSGFVRNNNEQMIEFIHTDLPEPVAPAINMCGILSKRHVTVFPSKSLPRKNSNGCDLSLPTSLMISRILTGVLFTFGISIPTALRPGIGASIRTSLAASCILMLSVKPRILDTLTFTSGRISNCVTDGPICIFNNCASISKLFRICSNNCDFSLAATSFSGLLPFGGSGSKSEIFGN